MEESLVMVSYLEKAEQGTSRLEQAIGPSWFAKPHVT